ncbi:MAG: polyprenyl synthetase family protein [Ruminococcaceae bacterium]|nr:polyprenyl synthetase family protein [Oscillospiraceae bacterium]
MIEYNKELAQEVIAKAKDAVERELEKIYPEGEGNTANLYEAIRYSLLSGGKRIRATLVLETCRMLGGQIEAALPFACAVEMVHAYSLIHDDLPCMDDDDMRRGKPTNHKVYGEATAILAGDGLLTDAFSVSAMNPYVSGDCAATAVAILSGAAGSFGMVKGQAADLYGESHELTEGELVELHMGKTGAMICASVQLGCLAAGYLPNDEVTEKLTIFARNIGLVFQIVDDVLDVTSTSEMLGKKVGSDKNKNKTTFTSFFSPESAMDYAQGLTGEAIDVISSIDNSEKMIALALYLCDRKN